MLKIYEKPVIGEIADEWINSKGIRLFIKREDKIHPHVSGNKWRKLRYNLEMAKSEGHDTLLTFGGAYSNHIYATAAAARESGFRSVGIIRGEKHLPLNPTLAFASGQGMLLQYMDRATYRRKHEMDVISTLRKKFGDFYLLPEGGTNSLAIKGAEEIVDDDVRKYDYVCSAVGTGGTIAGIISGMNGRGEVIGFSALKGDFFQNDIQKLLQGYKAVVPSNWHVNSEDHFGGYAKVKPELIQFIRKFHQNYSVPLDPVYTGKMMYGIYDMISKERFRRGSSVLAVHTGGLQGIEGMKERKLM